jgi:hypothetical protein
MCRYSGFKTYLVLWLCITTSISAVAQSDSAKALRMNAALEKAIWNYDQKIGRNSFLFTGRVYAADYGSVRNHQFFEEDYWEEGTIVYEEQQFDSIYMMFDIYNNEILLEHFNSDGYLAPIMLDKSKVSSFEIMGHLFVKLEKDTVSGLNAGFYDKLHTGNQLEVYVLRKKEISKSNTMNNLYEEFIENNKYYLKKDGIFHRIRRRKDIWNSLREQKKPLRRYLRKNALLFNQEPEITLVTAVTYYENL